MREILTVVLLFAAAACQYPSRSQDAGVSTQALTGGQCISSRNSNNGAGMDTGPSTLWQARGYVMQFPQNQYACLDTTNGWGLWCLCATCSLSSRHGYLFSDGYINRLKGPSTMPTFASTWAYVGEYHEGFLQGSYTQVDGQSLTFYWGGPRFSAGQLCRN